MQKVDGVQAVHVSLKDGLTVLDLRNGNAVTLAKLRGIIKNNGFVSKEAQVVARGRLVDAAGADFEVSGSGERLRASSGPVADSGDEWRLTVAAPK
jgi:hypothetical protein